MDLLDDDQMARFLRDGFVVLEPDRLDNDFHAAMYEAACQVHDEARAIGGDSNHLQVIGDNLRARIPDLDRLLGDRTAAEPWMRTFIEHLDRARFNERTPRPAPR